MAADRQIQVFLQEQGLASAEVLAWIQEEGVEFTDDLAHAFRSTSHIAEEAPFMLEPWLAAAQRKTEAWRRGTDVAQARRALAEASSTIRLAFQPDARRKAPARKPRSKRTGKPKAKPLAKAASVDKQARQKAASAAVTLSLSWAPQAGIARGLTQDDELIHIVREVHEERIALFEPKGVWAAINEWTAWLEYRTKYATRNIRAEDEVLLAAHIAGKDAATGPLAAWNRFDWLRRHLRTDVPLEVVAKPAKKGGPDGKIRQNDQAVAMPPEFLMAFETALERMVEEQDWRRNPLAAALQIAYSLIRAVHLGRSQFTHQNAVVFWLEAFRGKGKRDGARRAFTWAMIRHGLTGFDIGAVLHADWEAWSKKVGYPLDYVAMDPESGTKLESAHIQAVMRAVAESFFPEPYQVAMVQPYSNRRFGGTLASITKTPPADIVAYGGWAGVPELAKVVTDSSEVLQAWKRSMPHLYSDRRTEEEEIQKLLHMSMLQGLIGQVAALLGANSPASWVNIENVALQAGADGVNTLWAMRTEAMAEVAKQRQGLSTAPVWGTEAPRRKQFTIEFIPGAKRPTLGQRLMTGAKRPKAVEAAAVEEVKAAEVSTGTETPVRDEWVLTRQSKYLHRIQTSGEHVFTACRWRKGPKSRKPIQESRIIWRGEVGAARSMYIQFCPDRQCQP